jgi:hypothetical protein
MKPYIILLIVFLIQLGSLSAQIKPEVSYVRFDEKVSKGSLQSFQFPFKDSSSRKVLIWLPTDYNPKVKYATIYMHDGQMLFVGIYNDPPNRYAEFFPKQAVQYMDTAYVSKLTSSLWNGELRADFYLDWIKKELIPFIEQTYSVSHKREDRFLIGSSMGGLISLYGLTRSPETFGGAACLSIHTPMINFQMVGDDAMNQLVLPFNTYLSKTLPSPKKAKIYIDRGTETLDAYYGPYHDVLLTTMKKCGYEIGSNYSTLVWEKTAHDEVSWANRLAVPIKFLLIKDK